MEKTPIIEARGIHKRFLAVHALNDVSASFYEDEVVAVMGENGADGITWVITRLVRPTLTPFAGARAHKNKRGPINCSIYDVGDLCLYCVASNEWDRSAPQVNSGQAP